MLGPPVLIGDRVAYVGAEEPHLATVRWLGRIPDIFQHQMVAGISLDEPQILGTTNGSIGGRKYFQCHKNHGKFVLLSDLVKEEEFFNIITGTQRDTRSTSRCSSRSDKNPLYMNTGASYNQPTYQNHLFETSDLHEREWIGGGLGGGGGEWSREEMWLQHEQQQHQREQHRLNRLQLQQQQQMMVSGDMLYEHWRPRHMVYEDVHIGQQRRGFIPQESYENTEQYRNNVSGSSQPIYPPLSEPGNISDYKKTSADNPFRCKSSMSYSREEPESVMINSNSTSSTGVADSFKSLLVGPGQSQGPSGDLLKKLEDAISRGDHKCAASLAKELAKLKISSRLTEQESDDKVNGGNTSSIKIKTVKANMFVEDAVSAQGPIVIEVNPLITVADLKIQVEKEFEIPVDVQKWILGKQLVSEDTTTLESQGVTSDGSEIYLYLVNPGEKIEEEKPEPLPASPPQKIPLVLPTEPNQKGRYWNYEMDRWSFCNSDDDEDRAEEVNNIEKDNAGDENGAAADGAEDEWEYYYDDVDIKPKEGEQEVNQELPQQKQEPPPKQAEKPAPKPKKKNVDGWECPVCTLVNPFERPGCMACTTERPADVGAVAAELEQVEEKPKEELKTHLDAYKQLENLDIIPNAETFECTICYLDVEPGDGVMLRECLHTFCKVCLAASIEHSESPKVKCPFKDDNYSCDMEILEREIKALVTPAVLLKLQEKAMKEAEANMKNTFHCKTPDCAGWTIFDDDVNLFKCPLCNKVNCITCQAVHEGMDCKQYQAQMLLNSMDENSRKTKIWMDELIEKGEALNCPSCQVLLLKKWGCDWVRCTYCRTEICWVTRQLRWGPAGKGDTSGGCKCMIDGRTKCHPMCNYCH